MINNRVMEATIYFSVQPVRAKLEDKGITTAFAFHEATGISYPTARVWWNGEPMARIDAPTLYKVASFLETDWRDLLVLIKKT